ncbi:hypothetical protein SAMN03159341_12262 [Paenibacillus sp. 1_12]|uniref:hypothetical protein n=1 Tax=Paenibacillus sp. 1_12 TaxID=1566278 RepID=UPI0008E58AB3|nr:hypothetical protein [Paenibacillus sp. 1_12]SFM25336.1 hypothetical protein SAMN03159341_12262 [Paenibacillus sp. 1_12]
MEAYGFNPRRKRNLDLGSRRNESTLGINLGSEIETIDKPECDKSQTPELSAKLIEEGSKHTETNNRSPHFGEGYQKVTVYLPTDLLDKLKHLKKERSITSYSEFITGVVRTRLTEKSS